MDDHTSKDQPQLVTVKRINSVYKQNPSNNSTTSLQDDQMIASSSSNIDKHGSQNSLQTSITNIFRVNHFFLNLFIRLNHYFCF